MKRELQIIQIALWSLMTAGVLLGTARESSAVVPATALVRVRVSQFTGPELATLSSTSDPTLFVLDSQIDSVQLTAMNPAAMVKNDNGAGNWFPALTPVPPASVPGYIELSIAPKAGMPVSFGSITFRTAARFPSNPSSLSLKWSQDAFGAVLSTINMSKPRTHCVNLTSTSSDVPTMFRWIAGNGFGSFGGGESGFSAQDVILSTGRCGTPACDPGTVCGDGILADCEQCDDGNTADGDGCSATCQSELIPGGGLARTDCTHEWLTQPLPGQRDRKGLPKRRLECTDDDSTCDFGAVSGSCTFHVALCLNAHEHRIINARTGGPACEPSDTAQVMLRSPSEALPADAADLMNRDALESVLAGLGGTVTSQCLRPRGTAGQPCTLNSQCDLPAASGNGACGGRVVAFTPALVPSDQCSAFASITVPLSGGHSAAKTLRLTARPSNNPLTGKRRPRDADSLTLVCKQ